MSSGSCPSVQMVLGGRTALRNAPSLAADSDEACVTSPSEQLCSPGVLESQGTPHIKACLLRGVLLGQGWKLVP